MSDNKKSKKNKKKTPSSEVQAAVQNDSENQATAQAGPDTQASYVIGPFCRPDATRIRIQPDPKSPKVEQVNIAEYISEHIRPVNTLTEQECAALAAAAVQTAPIRCGRRVFAKIDVRVIFVDTAYQRMNAEDATGLVNKFDEDKTHVITLSYRDGRLYSIDGDHRIVAAILNGKYYLTAEIFMDMTQKEEARMFAEQDDNNQTLKPNQRHRAGICWENPVDMVLQEVCHAYGFTITPCTNMTYAMTAASKGREIVAKYGCESNCIEWILSLVYHSNWGNHKHSTSSKWLDAFESAYHKALLSDNIETAWYNLTKPMYHYPPDKFGSIAVAMYPHEDHRRAAKILIDKLAKGEKTILDMQATETKQGWVNNRPPANPHFAEI